MKKRKRNKDRIYFQIKTFIQKERESWFKEYQKYLELGLYEKFHTLARLDQSVWLVFPWGPVFDLAKYVTQVYPTFVPTQNSTQKPLVVGYEKRNAKYQMPLVRFHTHLSNRVNHLRNLNLFHKTYKTSW
jgi:hypothetical protein